MVYPPSITDCHWLSAEKPIQWMFQTFILPRLNSPNYLPCKLGWRKTKWKEGSGAEVIWQGGSRKTTELATFKLKSCLNPLCCKIRFPLFSQGQRPWKHLWLSRRPEPASPSSAEGMEMRDGERWSMPGAESLYPEELWQARRTFTAPAQKLNPEKPSSHNPRPPG